MQRELTQEMIDNVFETAADQGEAVIGMYKIAFPEWDRITKIHDGYPHVSSDTSTYIFGKAIAFDKEHHPDVLAGGAWMNSGFSGEEGIPDWVVDTSDCRLELKPAAAAA